MVSADVSLSQSFLSIFHCWLIRFQSWGNCSVTQSFIAYIYACRSIRLSNSARFYGFGVCTQLGRFIIFRCREYWEQPHGERAFKKFYTSIPPNLASESIWGTVLTPLAAEWSGAPSWHIVLTKSLSILLHLKWSSQMHSNLCSILMETI